MCSFVEFDTSIIYHLLVYCFGLFLLQDLFLSLQVFAFKEQNITLTVSVLLTRILYNVTPGPAMITFSLGDAVALLRESYRLV